MAEVVRCLLWDFDANICREYQRVGYCTRCGECCRGPWRYKVWPSPREPTALRPQGCWAEVRIDGKRWFFQFQGVVPGRAPCPALGVDNVCAIYEARLPICRAWPTSILEVRLHPSCGYRFVKVGERRILRC